MKASNKRIFVTVISFLFVLLLAAMPMTAFAEEATFDKIEMDGTTSTYGAYVYAKGVDISPLDGDFSEEKVYSMTVSHSRTPVSSFQMSIRMPYFVDVKNVYASDVLLNNAETAAFEWHIDEKGYVNVSYSSPYSIAQTDLFTVEFALNSTDTAYENVECVYSEFVDEGAKTVNAEVDLGYVSIGVAEIVVMGDVNGDKIVNLADLLIIQRSIVNKGYALTDEQFAVADINRDGEISMIDCQYIQNFLVGKIDSLENINSATYSIDVLITDQNGNWLYNGSFVANSGELYSNYMAPIFKGLSHKYNIVGNLSIHSDVYGTVDPNSNGEGFVVIGKDYLVMTVEVNYGNEGDKIYVTGSDLLPYDLTVTAGTPYETLLARILSEVKFFLYLSDGSTCEVGLTEDMLDMSEVMLDVEGYYPVFVKYYNSEFNYDASNSIQLHVAPDTSKWQHLGTYTFAYDGYNAFGWETFDFYAEAVVIDGEEFCEWTASEDGIISVTNEGVTILMQIDDRNKTVSFYKPSDALIGTYTFSEGDMTMTFAVYGQYGGAGEYVTCMTQTMIGDGGMIISAGFTTYVQLDLESRILYPSMMRVEFIINEDNSLTMKECEHEWQYNTQAPTCTNPGWENQYCTKCGEGMGHEIPALGHSVNADGTCGICGEYVGGDPSLDAEFLAYREERMANVKAEWYNTLKRYPEAAEMYQIRFDRLYATIKNATTYDEVERYCKELYSVMNEIREKFGSSVETDYIVGAYTGAFPAEVMQYSSVDEYLSQIVGIDAYIDCSLSGRHIITVTYDMLRNIENLNFSAVGDQFFFIYCEIEGVGSTNIQINVTVKPDMESAEALGTYTVSSDITSIPWSEVTFYSNGIAVFSTGETCYYTVNDSGVYRISYVQSMPGLEVGSIETILLMVVDDSTKVISYYRPTESVYRTFYYRDGIYMTITLYGDYIGSGEYIARIYQEAKMSDGYVMKNEATTVAYLDEKRGTLNCSGIPETFYYDEGGNLAFGNESCQHNNVGTNSFIGDCWNDGYDETFCYDCGTVINRIITNPAGHIYNEKGVCERCGNSIGGEIVDDSIQMTQADFSMIGISVNDTEADLINKMVGQKFYVYYSQSGMVEMTVTADMIDVSEIPFGSEGGNEGRINFTSKDGTYCTIHFYVIIMPDLSDVEYQIYKIVNGDALGLYELKVYANGVVLMSGDGMDNYPGSYTQASFKENVILFDMDGGYLVFELGEGVADFYKPEAELESIKTFYMSNKYMSLVMTAYGSYTGAGDYVATMTVTERNPETGEEFTMTITTMLYLDMDSSVVRHVMFGERNYDEAGNMYCSHANVGVDSWEGDCWSDGYRAERCYDCGEQISYEVIPAGHKYDESGYCPNCGNYEGGYGEIPDGIYQYIEKYLSAMCNEWNGIVMSYNVNEGQQALFNELTRNIKEATSYEQVDEIFHGQFRALCDEVINNSGSYVHLNGWELMPNGSIHVTVGTSADEFVSMLVNDYFVRLYLSDGSTVDAPILYEMISLDGVDLSSVGKTNLNLFFTYEQHSINFMLQVYVDPDMSNAELVFSYAFIGDVYNGMEWDTVQLYDNGIAILYCAGEVDRFVEYNLSDDGILTYVYYDATVAYRVTVDGADFYKQDEIIGQYAYTEDGEGFSLTVYGTYAGYGEYYAYLEMLEYNNDGSEDRYAATTAVIFNLEESEIYCELIGGWMTFDENGNVTPKECEHTEIDEKGYCAQCGRNMNENYPGDSKPGDVVVTPNVPSYDYTENGDYTYTDGNYDYTYTDKVLDGNYSVTYN